MKGLPRFRRARREAPQGAGTVYTSGVMASGRLLRRLNPLPVLDRLVLREVLWPTLVGFGTYTFMLLMRAIFGLMEQIFVRGTSVADAARLLLVTLPHVVVLTVPMSFLFGVLIAMGRMNADSEIIALQASGVSLRRVLRPILVMGLVLTAFNGYLMLEVMPRSNQKLRKLKVKLFASARALGTIEARVFYEQFPGFLLYVRDVDPSTGVWRNVLLYERGETGDDQLIVAKKGRLVYGNDGATLNGGDAGKNPANGGEPWLRLSEVTNYQFSRDHHERFRVNRSNVQLVRLYRKESGTQRMTLGMRERSTRDLLAMVQDGRSGNAGGSISERDRRFAAVELQKRLAIPAACMVFGLIALPLGIGSRSGGRGRGFLLSIGVIVVYYVILNNGELVAREGKVPAFVGVWAANVVLAVLGVVLLRSTGRWLGERGRGGPGLLTWIGSWRIWRGFRSTRGPAAEGARPRTGAIQVAQKRGSMTRFPAMLDRYVMRRFLTPLLFVLTSTAMLYVIIDLADKVDEMAKHTASFSVFAAYYWNLIPQVFLDVTPLGILIAVLLFLAMLERSLELTALKAAGISLYRVIVPVVLVTAAASVGLGIFQESVVPTANREARRLLDRIKGRKVARSYGAADRQWVFSRDGTTLYNFLRYLKEEQVLVNFTMFRFSEDGQLRFQLYAEQARYQDGAWVVVSGWYRKMRPDGTDEFHPVTRPMELDVPEAPQYFAAERRSPSQMSFRELKRHIVDLTASGYRPTALEVRLQQKLSYPLSVFVMVLLGIPFGLNRSGGRRSSPIQGIALALGLGIGYFLLVAIFGKMGEAGLLPAVLGAWAPVILAGLLGVNRLTTLKT